MIYLSASSIRDFLKCSQRHYYKRTVPEEAIQTVYQVEGTVVHKIIEDYWYVNEWYSVIPKKVDEELNKYSIVDVDRNKIIQCLSNFYDGLPDIRSKMREHDLREYWFEEKISKDVILRGKIDYIIKDENIVLDWKTGTTKTNISNDIQFIIYYEMYRKIFGQVPQVKQVNLANCKVSDFYPSSKYINTLFDVIIPMVVKRIKKNEYYREGFYNGACYNCDYIGVCSRDA